jgi:MFS transporter, ACS family, pantothenate transporter
MNLWLKDQGYSVQDVNQLPTIVFAITIVSAWLGTTLAAIYPAWVIYTAVEVCLLFSGLCMIIWDIPRALM